MAIDFKAKLQALKDKAAMQASDIPTHKADSENLTTAAKQTEILSGCNVEILTRLAQLEADLLAQNPGISDNLRLIHRAMLNDPSQVTLLTIDQRALFFQGLMHQTMTVITTAASKSKSSGTRSKAAKDLNMDDFC